MADTGNLTLDQLLEFIKDFTVRQYTEHRRGADGAILADAIRRRYPTFSYRDLGLSRLGDAVASAEDRGLIARNRNVAHLEILPGPASGVDATATGMGRSQFLRPEIWRALVFLTSNERHFLDRQSGRVRSISADDEESLGNHVGNPNFVELSQIPSETQKEWVRDFVKDQEGLNQEEAPLDDPQWWMRVPEWLRGKSAEFERNWRRERSQRVVAAVKEWAAEHDVSASQLFAPQTRKAGEPSGAIEPEGTRRALLAAIGDMQLHELEDLSIPFRYLIRHFRAR